MSRRVTVGLLVLMTVLGQVALDAPPARAAPPLGKSQEEMIGDGDLDAEDLVGRATVGRGAARTPPGGETWVSLAGFTRQTPLGDREIGGLVVVGLPLDRIARAEARRGIGMTRTSTRTTTSTSTGSGTLGEGDGVTPRLARAAVEAAWRAAGLGNDDARLDAIVSRARWSGLLPETRLRAIRYDDQRLYTDASSNATPLRDSAGANLGLEARLTWRFDRLLYAEDEPSFERMRLERHDARARIAGRVLEALFHWHRAWLELRWAQAASRDAREPPGRPSRDEAESALRVMEAEATLDVLTSGWFTAWRPRFAVTRPLPSGATAIPETL